MMPTESLPPVTVELDGSPLDDDAAASLLEVRVLQHLCMPSLCELVFAEPRGELARAERLLPGTTLSVRIEDDAQILFDGEITSLQHCHGPANQLQIRLRAFDRLHRLRKRQPVRGWADLNLQDLAGKLTEDIGLDVCIDEPGPLWPRIMQWRQSDLELLTEVASRCGMYFFLRERSLAFATLAGSGTDVELSLGTTLLEAQLEATAEPACRSVNVRAWDSWTAQSIAGTATVARVGREVGIDPASGSEGLPRERTLVDENAQTEAHATALAQAELDRRVAGEVTVNAVAAGNAQLHPGRRVKLLGVAAPFVGRYVLTSVIHTIDRTSGFRSAFNTAAPAAIQRARGSVTTFGIVLDSDDPQKLGRVRVTLPNYCDIETDWLEVLSPGGGSGKGLVTVPDTGDRVLLLLPREDPAQALVLGGLFASDGPPDSGVRDRRVYRYTLVTRGGQRLYLEEEQKVVRLENGSGGYLELAPDRTQIANGAGSYVELTKDHMRLHASCDINIEAPGRALRFRSASVDFERG